MKLIKMGNSDKLFIIDDEDFDFVSKSNWSLSGFGYVYNKDVYLHKILLGVTDSKIKVDHKDRNKLNCQKENLRKCEHYLNLANHKLRLNHWHKKSKYRGVARHRASKGWCTRFMVNGKEIWGGTFKSEIEAAKKANELMKLYRGEFAQLNIIEDENSANRTSNSEGQTSNTTMQSQVVSNTFALS